MQYRFRRVLVGDQTTLNKVEVDAKEGTQQNAITSDDEFYICRNEHVEFDGTKRNTTNEPI